MDVILAIGQERARFQTCLVSKEEVQTAQAFQVEILTTHRTQEATEEVGDHLTKETAKYETSRTGSEKDRCCRLCQLLLR